MKVFVTGAAGQIGRPLVEALLARGDQVTVLVRARRTPRAPFAAGVRVLEGGLEDTGAVAGAIAGAGAGAVAIADAPTFLCCAQSSPSLITLGRASHHHLG